MLLGEELGLGEETAERLALEDGEAESVLLVVELGLGEEAAERLALEDGKAVASAELADGLALELEQPVLEPAGKGCSSTEPEPYGQP